MAISVGTIKDSAIEEILAQRKNIEVLEEILARDKIHPLWKPEIGTPIGNLKSRYLTKSEISEMFTKIMKMVDSFLEVSNIEPPSCGYYTPLEFGMGLCDRLLYIMGLPEVFESLTRIDSSDIPKALIFAPTYFAEKNSIILKRERYIDYASTISHEYCHHVQKKLFGLVYDKAPSFSEGHARGVERHISRAYTLELNDPGFIDCIEKETLCELSSVFGWLCIKHKELWRVEDLMRAKPKKHPVSDTLSKNFYPTEYDFGNTLFFLAERKYGSGVYAAALKGELDFLDI